MQSCYTAAMATDYYSVLGVPRSAADKDIRDAFRKLARQYHPDVNPGNAEAEERFKQISAAQRGALRSRDARRLRQVRRQLAQRRPDRGADAPPECGRLRLRWRPRRRARRRLPARRVRPRRRRQRWRLRWPLRRALRPFLRSARAARAPARRGRRAAGAREPGGGLPRRLAHHRAARGQPASRAASRSTFPPVSPTARACACVARAVRGAAAALRATSSCASASPATRASSAATTTSTSTSTCRSPTPRSVGRRRCRPSRGARWRCGSLPETQGGRVFRLAGQGMPRAGGGHGDLLARVRLRLPEPLDDGQRALFEQLRASEGEREGEREDATAPVEVAGVEAAGIEDGRAS